ncbi:hypothetical protein OB2597_09439 [Pseudooceanicola batsensis HTCC2597]|uniref:DUF6473 domain-containing protein n=1 Tax=Pseudooceanicola batsensis (strain ATCC BAA-863 / DSM 15984 / KCTC 12145 / HTCC2597) TaxID=252305 RepID=A3TV10_PSEBH|nr:DUF6473 family protein [Pseudooceanicola batsensis]EAQ04356.1 hypothetical protein OB2597_09439 [Pseudooceanicola batsensis HTCC2597]
MTFERLEGRRVDYMPCRYGTSRTLFRGPKSDLSGPHVLCLGGTETYGKFLQTPYPALIERMSGLTAVNLGVAQAGPDIYLNDRDLLAMTGGARATVIQVMGAQNMSNRHYTVHPRRNDRFLAASPLLRTVYREVDFTRFHFTRHMLTVLQDLSADRFAILRAELQVAWVARMRALIELITSPVVLLWLADRALGPNGGAAPLPEQSDPLFVTAEMIDALRPGVAAVVEAPASPDALLHRTEELVFSQVEAPAAATLLGAQAHRDAARAVAAALRGIAAHPATETTPGT